MTFIWIWRFECPPPAKFWTKQPPIYSQQCRNNKENLLSHITRNPGVGFLELGSQVHSFSISVVLSKSQSRSIFLLCRYHYLALTLAGSCMDIRELPQLWVSHAAKKQGLLFLDCFSLLLGARKSFPEALFQWPLITFYCTEPGHLPLSNQSLAISDWPELNPGSTQLSQNWDT